MVVIDIETTGLNPFENSIIEIGAIDFYNPKNQFSQRCRIRENSVINKKALEVNGYTLSELYDKNLQSEKQLLLNFISWIEKIEFRTLAGQNVNFDLSFLNATKDREQIIFEWGRRIVDIHSVAYTHMVSRGINPPLNDGNSKLGGDFIMKYVGIPPEPRPHSGINGALYETEALGRLIFGKGVFDRFKEYKLNS